MPRFFDENLDNQRFMYTFDCCAACGIPFILVFNDAINTLLLPFFIITHLFPTTAKSSLCKDSKKIFALNGRSRTKTNIRIGRSEICRYYNITKMCKIRSNLF